MAASKADFDYTTSTNTCLHPINQMNEDSYIEFGFTPADGKYSAMLDELTGQIDQLEARPAECSDELYDFFKDFYAFDRETHPPDYINDKQGGLSFGYGYHDDFLYKASPERLDGLINLAAKAGLMPVVKIIPELEYSE